MKHYTNGLEILNETHVKTRRLGLHTLSEIVPTQPPKTQLYESYREVVPELNAGKSVKQRWEVYTLSLSKAQELLSAEVSRHHDTRKLSPVTVSIQGADYQFKGGLESEGAIAKQEELSADLGLQTVKLWGLGEKSVDATYEESKSVRRIIGLQYAQHYDEQKTAIKNIKSAVTVTDAQDILDDYLILP